MTEGTKEKIKYIIGGLIAMVILNYLFWYSFTH
jgi:hypothetical protein